MSRGNRAQAVHLIEALLQRGVREFVVCAGSRNSPLVAALAESAGVKIQNVWSHPEERSAAFFALGRARSLQAPVAIVTTSGTAAAELLPATIEAYYSGVPLVLVTADRPHRFRGTGAPQSIEQQNLFGPYCPVALDIDGWDALQQKIGALGRWNAMAPLHVNIAFEEPLLAEESSRENADSGVSREVQAAAQNLQAFWKASQRPLVLLGALAPSERRLVRDFVLRLGAPVYAEALSGLREEEALAPLLIRGGEKTLSAWANGGGDAVLRLGGVPTTRLWRDLDETHSRIPVLSLSALPYSGLSRGGHRQVALGSFLESEACHGLESRPASESFWASDRQRQADLFEILAAEPRSELALIHALSRRIPPASLVFLGNSLPIREWDLVAHHRRVLGEEARCFEANRGANGIDGEVSTFLGLCAPDRENWALLGDLTTLYDLAGPWVLRQLDESIGFQIVVINNGGGRIFSRVPSLSSLRPEVRHQFFENAHALSFQSWAALWDLGYESWDRIPPHNPAQHRGVVEILPDSEASARVWSRWERVR